MKVEIKKIKDNSLRHFFEFLKKNNFANIVVVGGAVRDLFFQQSPNDIDIAIKIKMNVDSIEKKYFMSIGKKEMLPIISKILRPLAKKLQKDVKDFENGNVVFEGLKIDILGLNIVASKKYNNLVLPDIFINKNNNKIYNFNTFLSVNMLGVDCEGNLYGEPDYLIDIGERVAKLQLNPLSMRLKQILDFIKLRRRHMLRFDSYTKEYILNYLHRLENDKKLFHKEFYNENTINLFNNVFNIKNVQDKKVNHYDIIKKIKGEIL